MFLTWCVVCIPVSLNTCLLSHLQSQVCSDVKDNSLMPWPQSRVCNNMECCANASTCAMMVCLAPVCQDVYTRSALSLCCMIDQWWTNHVRSANWLGDEQVEVLRSLKRRELLASCYEMSEIYIATFGSDFLSIRLTNPFASKVSDATSRARNTLQPCFEHLLKLIKQTSVN